MTTGSDNDESFRNVVSLKDKIKQSTPLLAQSIRQRAKQAKGGKPPFCLRDLKPRVPQ